MHIYMHAHIHSARFFGRTVEIQRAVFRNNTAKSNGGGAQVESGTQAAMHNCTFRHNVAGSNGGALVGSGTDAEIHVVSSSFDLHVAFNEGGSIFLSGNAWLKLSRVFLTRSRSLHGGGASTRGDSSLVLTDEVVIRHCQSRGLGGGMLVAGASLDITVVEKPVIVEDNMAKDGGGVCVMCRVTLNGEGTTLIQSNVASMNGGGVYGFSSYAKIIVNPEHTLMVKENLGEHNGGGIALAQGAQLSILMMECDPKCSNSMRGNGECNTQVDILENHLSLFPMRTF